MAVSSLVLGICALVFPFIGLGWLSMLLGIVGIVLGTLAKKRTPEKQSMATAGVVMSIIAVALGLLSWIACAACVGGLATLGGNMNYKREICLVKWQIFYALFYYC